MRKEFIDRRVAALGLFEALGGVVQNILLR